MVDAAVSNTARETCVGSSPIPGTTFLTLDMEKT